MSAQRVVGDQVGLQAIRRVDDGHRDARFGGDLGCGGVVAAGMGDHQVGALGGEFAQRCGRTSP